MTEKFAMSFSIAMKALREERGFSQQALANALSLTRSAITNYENGESTPNLKKFTEIARFFGVSADYLLGLTAPAHPNAHLNAPPTPENQEETYIFREPAIPTAAEPLQVTHRRQPYPSEVQIKPLLVTVDQHGRENITLVESRAAAGYVSHFMEPEYVQNLPAFQIPRPEFRNATFRGFEVQGQSMAPTFQNGELAIASFVDNWPQNIKNGCVYVIITPYAILIKRVLNRTMERQTLALKSDNEEYETYEISSLDVLEMWDVRASIRFKFPDERAQGFGRLNELEADVSYLLREVEELRAKDSKTPKKGSKNAI